MSDLEEWDSPEQMVIGLETELAVVAAGDVRSAVAASTAVVDAWQADQGGKSWCYVGEDPLVDVFGNRVGVAQAAPSQLTHLETTAFGRSGGPRMQVTNVALESGGRFYVDHAHPEVSTPECLGATSAVAANAQVLEVARRAGELAGLRLFNDNVDGKGQTWGHHENYRIPREVDFADLTSLLMGHLITRPVFCGAGRVGIGTSGGVAGFQLSARADYIESDYGLQTTFDRPLINTRDEPHDDSGWRRLHVIVGDANCLPYSAYLRVSSTALVLWALVRKLGRGSSLDELSMLVADPVLEVLRVSHDRRFTHRIRMASGAECSALELSGRFADMVATELDFSGISKGAPRRDLEAWRCVLADLAAGRNVGDRVEWAAKLALVDRLRERHGVGFDDPRVEALDIAWAELGRGVAARLDRSGAFKPIPGDALEVAPRARLRSQLLAREDVMQVGWSHAVIWDGQAAQVVPLGSATAQLPPDLGSRDLIEFLRSRNG